MGNPILENFGQPGFQGAAPAQHPIEALMEAAAMQMRSGGGAMNPHVAAKLIQELGKFIGMQEATRVVEQLAGGGKQAMETGQMGLGVNSEGIPNTIAAPPGYMPPSPAPPQMLPAGPGPSMSPPMAAGPGPALIPPMGVQGPAPGPMSIDSPMMNRPETSPGDAALRAQGVMGGLGALGALFSKPGYFGVGNQVGALTSGMLGSASQRYGQQMESIERTNERQGVAQLEDLRKTMELVSSLDVDGILFDLQQTDAPPEQIAQVQRAALRVKELKDKYERSLLGGSGEAPLSQGEMSELQGLAASLSQEVSYLRGMSDVLGLKRQWRARALGEGLTPEELRDTALLDQEYKRAQIENWRAQQELGRGKLAAQNRGLDIRSAEEQGRASRAIATLESRAKDRFGRYQLAAMRATAANFGKTTDLMALIATSATDEKARARALDALDGDAGLLNQLFTDYFRNLMDLAEQEGIRVDDLNEDSITPPPMVEPTPSPTPNPQAKKAKDLLGGYRK